MGDAYDPTMPSSFQASALPASPAAAPAGGTGTAAGGWDTAADRDLAIATINGNKARIDAIEIALRAAGLVL